MPMYELVGLIVLLNAWPCMLRFDSLPMLSAQWCNEGWRAKLGLAAHEADLVSASPRPGDAAAAAIAPAAQAQRRMGTVGGADGAECLPALGSRRLLPASSLSISLVVAATAVAAAAAAVAAVARLARGLGSLLSSKQAPSQLPTGRV